MSEMRQSRKPGPRRRYPPDVEREQALFAQMLSDSGATWSDVIVAFDRRGWRFSQSMLQKRFVEWGIRR